MFPVPQNEAARLQALESYSVLDTPTEPELDELARLASRVCGTPIALVSLTDHDRQFYKARVGLDMVESPRETAFCAHAILATDLFVVEDAEHDPRFENNPNVTERGLRFYAGAPLVCAEGFTLGTLCVIDTRPRSLTAEQRDFLQVLARNVVTQLELRRALRFRDRLREVLARDVLSPLADVASVVDKLLGRCAFGSATGEALARVSAEAEKLIRRVEELSQAAAAALGAPVPLRPRSFDLGTLVRDAVAELASAHPQRGFGFHMEGDTSGRFDPERAAQLVLSLVETALDLAAPNASLAVSVKDVGDAVELAVSFSAPALDAKALSRLFDPLRCPPPDAHAAARGSLGLGLPIARHLVAAHGGRMELRSRPGEGTTFAVTLPRSPPSAH